MNQRESEIDIAPRDRSTAFFVFGFLLVCYLLTYTGIIQSSDGLAMFATTESMVRRGEIDSNQLVWMANQQGNFGPDGELYSRKGLGMSLLAAPLVWLAWLWPALGLVHAALLLNPLLTAWTGALIFRSGRRLGWSRNTAIATALIFGLATLAWPYTQTLFSDPVCGLGLFAAAYGLLSYRQTGRKRYLLGAGIMWGLAYLARVINLVTLPIYVVGLAWVVAGWGGLLAPPRESWWTILRRLGREQWRPFVSFLAPVVAAGLISLWWNAARYGNIWDSGYVETERFDGVWWFGVAGLLAGPARGLIWYSPALLMAIPGVAWFWRQARGVLVFCLAISVVYVLVYGKWYMWHGGYSWGPRFIVPVLPFLALLCGPTWERWMVQRRWGVAGQIALGVLVAISVGVQWLGMLVRFDLVQNWLDANVQPLFAPITFVRLEYSPLVLQWQFLRPENIILALWNNSVGQPAFDWPVALALGVALLFGGVVLVRRSRRAETDEAGAGDSLNDWLYGAALVVLTVVLLMHYFTKLTDPQMRLAAQRIALLEKPDDAVVNLMPTRAQEFANAYHGRLPTYGFLPEGVDETERQAWEARLVDRYARVWLLPGQGLPEQSSWERDLRGKEFLLQDTRMAEPEGQRLALYAFAEAQALTETGIGTVFGDPARVNDGITEENGWIRLQGYAMTPETHPGQELLLALHWESLRPVDYNYQVFVHLLDVNDEKLAQRDGQPVLWLRPTSTWQPGEEIVDRYALLLPDDLPIGSYTIAVGLYDPVSGLRLPVSAGSGDYAIRLGPVLVTPPP